MEPKRIKLLIVGDTQCGKTCLLIRYTHKTYPEEYVPTVFDNYVQELQIDGTLCWLSLWDTRGYTGPDYERLRPLSYPCTDVFLISFNVALPDSFENVEEKWVPELKEHYPETPIMLVGNKMDLRNDKEVIKKLSKVKEKTVTVEQGEEMAKRIKAAAYMECSALTGEGVDDVFESAAQIGLEFSQAGAMRKKKKCIIM